MSKTDTNWQPGDPLYPHLDHSTDGQTVRPMIQIFPDGEGSSDASAHWSAEANR